MSVCDNLCVRPKVGNAILYELQTNTNKSQFGHANCTKFKKIYSQQGRQASPIMTIYTNYTVNLAQRLLEGEGKRGEWHRQSTVGTADLPLASHCALCNNNNNNNDNRITSHRTWHCRASLLASLLASVSLPGKSYANACVWHFSSNFIVRPVAKLFRAWFLPPWRVMHFEFSSHTHTHSVSCSLAVYFWLPRPSPPRLLLSIWHKTFSGFCTHHISVYAKCWRALVCVFLCGRLCGSACVCTCVFVCLCGVSGKRISRLLPPHIKINTSKCVLASYSASAQPRLSWGYFPPPHSLLFLATPPWQMRQMSSFMWHAGVRKNKNSLNFKSFFPFSCKASNVAKAFIRLCWGK